MFADNPKGLAGVARYQNALAVREKMPYEISDGMRLARTRWALHQNRTMLIQACRYANLFKVRCLAQEDV
jgi:hypothetical protein